MSEPNATPAPDPFVSRIRERISDNDREIVEAINRRLELVAELKGYKEQHGLPLFDNGREESLLRYLANVNGGPLSEEGLRALYKEILDLTKREVFS